MITLKCITGELVELNTPNLSGSDLSELELHRLIARGQNFDLVNARSVKMRNAIVHHSSFVQANFEGASLINLEAFACNFEASVLDNARLIGAQFNWSRFPRATFANTDLGGASFQNCWLCGSDFSLAKRAEEADFTGAIYDDSTIWPANFLPANGEQFEDMNGVRWSG